MPSSHGRAIAAVAFVFVLTFSSYAHADTSVVPIGDPYTDTLQLWSNIVSAVEALANDLATSLIAIQPHAANSNDQNPQRQHPSGVAQSAAAALATQSGSNTAASSTNQNPSATSIGSVSNTTSDQTTNSSNVKSAVSPPTSPFESALNQQPTNSNKSAVFSPTPNFVTQDELNAQLSLLSNVLTAKFSAPATSAVPQYIAAGGNPTVPYAAVSDIGNLSNVTITNANLTASEIPALNYFPSTSTVSVSYGGTGTSIAPTYGQLLLGNGNGGYNLTATSSLGIVSGSSLLSAANSWTGLNLFSSGASTTNFSNFGTAYFGGTATSSFNSAGALSLASALGVGSGGTGANTFGQGWLFSNGGTGALAASTSPTINYITATSTTATSTFGGNLSVGGSLSVSGGYQLAGNPIVSRLLISPSPVQFWVTTGGSDSNTCRTFATACATIQHAVDLALQNWDAQSGGASQNYALINLQSGVTFSQSVTVTGQIPGNGYIWIAGNGGAATISSGNSTSVTAQYGARVVISNLTLTSTGSANCLSSQFHSTVTIGAGVTFSSCGGSQIDAETFANVVASSGFTLSGTSASALHSNSGGDVGLDNVTITCSGNPSYSVYFAGASWSYIEAIGTAFTSCSGVTGARFTANRDASIRTNTDNLNFFPGSLPGTLASNATFDDYGTAGDFQRTIVSGSSDTASTADNVIVWDSNSGAAKTETLPSCSSTGPWEPYTIKDGYGDASVNPITISPTTGTIDGATSYAVATNYDQVTLLCNGTQYSVLSPSRNNPVFSGKVGIGTTTPYSRLEVWGPDTGSTTAFAVVNNSSTTAFAVYDNGNATYLGSIFQSSDQRLKTNITSLTASSSLSAIEALNPVSYFRLDQPGTGENLGFIAQQVGSIFPELVSTTSATALTPGGTLTLNYEGLISPIVAAIQALSSELTSIENTIAGFAQSFTTQQLTFTRDLCAEESNGAQVCITGDQLAALVAQAGEGSGNSSQSGGGANPSGASNSTDTPPVIQINGDNPAIVQVGDTYNDLGATITSPQQDLNLGISTYVNGIEMSPVQIDTTAAATDTIQYVATDQTGLTATSTRTVIVEAPSIVPTDNASTTATTTAQ